MATMWKVDKSNNKDILIKEISPIVIDLKRHWPLRFLHPLSTEICVTQIGTVEVSANPCVTLKLILKKDSINLRVTCLDNKHKLILSYKLY